jgi:hypothetical protein
MKSANPAGRISPAGVSANNRCADDRRSAQLEGIQHYATLRAAGIETEGPACQPIERRRPNFFAASSLFGLNPDA